MRILIELPTWIGDSIMATPSIENIIKLFDAVEITLIGSVNSIEILKDHPKVVNTFILEKNIISSYKVCRKLGQFDLFFSFRNSFKAKLIKFSISSKKKYQYNKTRYKKIHHQVEKYNHFVNNSLRINSNPSSLVLHSEKVKNKNSKNKLMGINPGASYGSAKRWYPEKFADVAKGLSLDFDIIIFGGPGEIEIANNIESYLIQKGVKNYRNLAGLVDINKLVFQISKLDLFITGDSEPMHIASAMQVPTVSIFGPTKFTETSQWMNKKSTIVKKNLGCQPCMKRVCPLKHHDCMKLIKPSEVLDAVNSLNL